MFQRLWDRAFRSDRALSPEEDPTKDAPVHLVLSLPTLLRDPIEARAPATLATADVFRQLLARAERSIKIFSPYVDPTFTALAQSARAPIQIVTTLREARMRSSPVLERLATTRPLAVRYLHEKHARSQMFQLHAKMILADSSAAYIGSANFTDTSMNYNFELGVTIEEPGAIARLHAIFDYVFDFAAKPAEQL